MKIDITAYVIATQYSWESKPSFQIWPCKFDSDTDKVCVSEQTFTVDVPDDFDIRPGKVAALEEQRRKLRVEFGLRITEIEKQISELQAIGCEVAA